MKKLFARIKRTYRNIIKALFKFGYITPLSAHQTMMLSDRKADL